MGTNYQEMVLFLVAGIQALVVLEQTIIPDIHMHLQVIRMQLLYMQDGLEFTQSFFI